MMTVTIPKKEYEVLVEAKLRYEYLRQIMEGDIFSPPPTKYVDEIVSALSKTKKYNKKFLNSLKKGLSRSSYFAE
ncbi:MAG: hypothetical protein KGZ58_00450 [Ignavibacteriales bacterium]|nr:hypothetical protein [Ignavibacteriales bacterium]